MPTARNVTTPWGNRKQLMMLGCAVSVLLTILPFWPIGGAVWGIFLSMAIFWPKMEKFEELSPDYIKARRIKLMRPLIYGRKIWRLGPIPGSDKQQKKSMESLQRGTAVTWWAPLSFSAIGSACVGMTAAGIEYALSYALAVREEFEFLGEIGFLLDRGLDPTVRWSFITVPLSGIFGWWCNRSYIYMKRYTRYLDEEGGDEYGIPPASVMRFGLWDLFKSVIRTKTSYISIATSVVVYLVFIYTGFPTQYIGPGATAMLLWTGIAVGLFAKPLLAEHRAQHQEWYEDKYERRQWTLRWAGAKGLALDEQRAPLIEDIQDYPPENPTHRTILFRMRAGTQFNDFAKAARQMASSMASQRVLVERYWQKRGEENQYAFTLTYQLTDVDIGQQAHLDPTLDEQTLQFVVKHAIVSAFLDLKFHTPLFTGLTVRSRPNADLLVETQWNLMDGDTFAAIADKTVQFQELLKCDWFRPFQDEGSAFVGFVFGANPDETELRVPHIHSLRLKKIDWNYLMRANKLVGSDGKAPTLEKVSDAPLGLSELTFRYPPAIDAGKVKARLDAIRGLSGYRHLEFEDHPDESNMFVLLVGGADPLTGIYKFSDYSKEILVKPRLGVAKTEWAVGIQSNGHLIHYKWDDEQPHLLVAGSSGSGKSGIINSFLCQLMHNNHPEDVRIWLIEPKNELQIYQNVEHVTRFLDFMVTSDSPHRAFAVLLEEALEEMAKRYSAFARHPKKPQKISEARDLARAEPETAGHLNFPYLFIVIEECANYFVKPQPEDKADHAKIMSYIQKLARESRAAGIYLLVATQYPTKENLPMTLKTQCRRIGLFTTNVMASLVIIDEAGLETIKERGRGKVSDGKRYAGFRGLLQERSDDVKNPVDERADMVAEFPRTQVWPKLPEHLKVHEDVEIIGAGRTEAAPVPPPPPPLPPEEQEGDGSPPGSGRRSSDNPHGLAPWNINDLFESPDAFWLPHSDDVEAPEVEISFPDTETVEVQGTDEDEVSHAEESSASHDEVIVLEDHEHGDSTAEQIEDLEDIDQTDDTPTERDEKTSQNDDYDEVWQDFYKYEPTSAQQNELRVLARSFMP